MSVTQSDFSQYSAIGFHGQLNTDFPSRIVSKHAEGGAVAFGVAVSYGTGDTRAVIGGATAAVLIGVTLRSHAVENSALGLPVYDEDKPMSVLVSGRMYAIVSDGSTQGGQVYQVPATGALVSTATANVALTGARFVRTAAAGEVSEIEIK